MTHKKNKHNDDKKSKNTWTLALERAELALYKNRARRSQIIQSIRFFQEQIKRGVPWPVERQVPEK